MSNGDLAEEGKTWSACTCLGLDAEICMPWGLPVFYWLVFKKFTLPLYPPFPRKTCCCRVFCINHLRIIMLQGRNNSHKWQLDYLSPRGTSSSTQFGATQLSTGPSGWVCRHTCCFHLLVLPPTKKKIAHFSRYSLSHNIYRLKNVRTRFLFMPSTFPLVPDNGFG